MVKLCENKDNKIITQRKIIKITQNFFGDSIIDYSNRDYYIGDRLGNLKHGKGIFKTSKYQYDGEWWYNKKKGKGKIIDLKLGNSWFGNWNNNKKNGFGMFRDKTNKETIFGIWKNDLFDKYFDRCASNTKYERTLFGICKGNRLDEYLTRNGEACNMKYMRVLMKYDYCKFPLNAALKAKDEYSVKALLDGGDDPNEYGIQERDFSCCNALITAALYGCSLHLFNRILDKTDDVNACEQYDHGTALMFAACDKLDMVIALMNHPGIDLNLRACDNETALHYAVEHNNSATLEQLLSDDRIDSSLKGGSFPVTGGEDYKTPLKLAIDRGHDECVKILREHGASEE